MKSTRQRPRGDRPGRVFHITARVNWRVWHLNDKHTRQLLAKLIAEAADRFGVRVIAWVIMANHIHLVVESPPPELFHQLTSRRTKCRHLRPWPLRHQNASVIAQFMRRIRHVTSIRRHAELELSGHFWEGDYDARFVETPASLAARIAYDHRNPVKVGLVARAELYPWSSAREWFDGTPGIVALATEPLPFGLDREDMRRSVLELQATERLDDCGEKLEELFGRRESASDEELRAALEDAGIDWQFPRPRLPI